MSGNGAVELVVVGGQDVVDGVLSISDGGTQLADGVRELVRQGGAEIDVQSEACEGIEGLRKELENGSSSLITKRPDVVLLSIADEVLGLGQRGSNSGDSVAAVKEDLVAVISRIKEAVGAHVLVSNVSTVDPTNAPFSYAGLPEEPFTLRAHRLNLMLIEISHDEGISIIDVDRLVAEIGASGTVEAPARYGPEVCGRIAAEVTRVLTEYGFFDQRPLLAQVGARHRES